jgi:hypothetical protein
MQVTNIASCCAGYQIKDFPGAHKEGPKSDKDTVLKLLSLMWQYRTGFQTAFVNLSQDNQMRPIFAFLGWKRRACGTRVWNYIQAQPQEWFHTHGFNKSGLNRLNILSLTTPGMNQILIDNHKVIKEQRLAIINEFKEERNKFYRKLQKTYGISQAEVRFLGDYEGL